METCDLQFEAGCIQQLLSDPPVKTLDMKTRHGQNPAHWAGLMSQRAIQNPLCEMKTPRLLRSHLCNVLLGVLILQTPFSGQAFQIHGLWNTGVDDAGNVLPLHTEDRHFSVSGQANHAYVVPRAVGADVWGIAPVGSAWIGPNATDPLFSVGPDGIYTYTLTFDFTGYDHSKLRVSGLWAADDKVEMWLNGQFTGLSKGMYGFRQVDPFVLDSGFTSGVNVLEFRVENVPVSGGNPTGLLISGLDVAIVPEPTCLSIALIGVMLILKRRHKAV